MGKVLASLASSDSGWLVPDYGSSFVRRLEADFRPLVQEVCAHLLLVGA